MKKQSSILLTLLFLVSWSWATAEEITVKVAGDRTAVLHVTDTDSPDPDVSGSMKGSADLKTGKSAFKGDFTFKDAAELEGAKAGIYAKMTGKNIEAIGFVDAKVPSEPDAPKVLDIKAETVTEGDASAANFKIDVVAPAGGEKIPTGSGDAKMEGDFKAIKSSGKFNFAGEEVDTASMPFKNFMIDITEVDTKTTISFEVKVPKDSPMAGQLDQIPMMAPMLEGQLKQVGVKYEGSEFPQPTEEGDLKVGKGKITLVDIRGTVKPFMGMAAAQMQAEMGPEVDAKTALENMLEVKFDKFNFALAVDTGKLDGTFEMNVSNLAKFYEGYMVILPAVQKQSNRELAREAGELGPLVAAFLELNSEQAAAAIKAAVTSEMKMSGEMKFNLGAKEGDVSFNADGNLNMTNVKDYIEKVKAAGLPVAEKAVGHFDLSLKEGTNLVGDMYFYTDGDLVTYYKGMLAKAAESAGDQEIVDVIKGLEFNDMTMKMDLQGNKMALEGNSSTSDLTPVTKVVMKKAAPQIEADLAGTAFDFEMPENADGKIDVKVYFSNFMPGKNEAQIKESLGLPGSATVTMDGSADETKLVAVEQAEIAIDGQLADVRSTGQKLLASSPADVASGATGGGGGGNKWGLIAVGLLLLVGVGGFMMFGKKS